MRYPLPDPLHFHPPYASCVLLPVFFLPLCSRLPRILNRGSIVSFGAMLVVEKTWPPWREHSFNPVPRWAATYGKFLPVGILVNQRICLMACWREFKMRKSRWNRDGQFPRSCELWNGRHALPAFVNRMDFMPKFSQLSYHKLVSKQSTFFVIMWNSTS